MEGHLRKYKNLLSGYQKCYGRIHNGHLNIQKDAKTKEG
jgi:hypothetical protein